ncbi:MAG: exodeoxyribonuclease V subunit gamma [Desulfuromonadaceae bacterium]|nr:exodeoxyribonuclease V subunit gamma [Desulfuromonadaceae bacterium]MDD2855081.1 exodeoxyribonuclease V subunit gamma [Desulfuromonadaceae bacterium]
MSILLYSSNRMEILLDNMASVLAEPVGHPLSRETIVVQSQGMSRWISMELAKKFGVWGNTDFKFPNKFVKDLFANAMPEIDQSDLFETEIMTWRVIRELKESLNKPEFEELQSYLCGYSSDLKMFQLAGKIADTFDQYTIYRGDLLEKWMCGFDPDWQASLWRELASDENGYHRGRQKSEFLDRIRSGKINADRLPERVILFGISYMPAFHLQIFAAIACHLDLHIFLLSPCREYWGDVLSSRKMLRQSSEFNALAEEGNSLLASLGELGRSFSNLIIESGSIYDAEMYEHEEYVEAKGGTLLASLQNGVLNLVGSNSGEKIEIACDDQSISVHSCHSAMREVEVLHDQLLEIFATTDEITPRDIIVMMPDIETYSPYISAVFSGNANSKHRIPFSIADRTVRNEGGLGDVFISILALNGGRFSAPEVIDILSADSVSRCFGISQTEIDLVKRWIKETNISWGMNSEDRVSAGLPDYKDGSWIAGIERLVFGYAMSSEDNELFSGVLPFDNIEGDEAVVLGRFVQFVRLLHTHTSELGRARILVEWKETLAAVLKNFFKPSKAVAREFNSIEKVIDSLGRIENVSGYSDDVTLEIIKTWFQRKLDNENAGVGFLSGKVTFCAMLPMRSIPVKIVALLGMSDGKFPRQSRSPGFDMIPKNPREGDRSLRDEDRYLFLEAILSARERLYISYTGLSIRDNSAMPPSVLVSELFDFLDRGYVRSSHSEDTEFHKTILTQHRLQPFSPAYFNGKEKGLFSYSTENLAAAKGFLNAVSVRPRFFDAPLSTPDESYREVRVTDLQKFFENPSAYILRNRLGIRGEEELLPIEDREIFELDGLKAYSVKKELLAHVIAGGNAYDLLPIIKARGVLPPAGKGDKVFEKFAVEVTGFADQVLKVVNGSQFMPPLDLDITIGKFRLYGRISNVLPECMLRYRSSKLSAKDQVKLWIEHLILNLPIASEYPDKSSLIMLDNTVTLKPVLDSEMILERLLSLYWDGLITPLHFFPRSSLEFATKGKISLAEAKWNNEKFPESNDPAYRLCFSDESPLDSEFESVALDVFKDYLDCMEVAE